MAYQKGNFYHKDGEQFIEGATLQACNIVAGMADSLNVGNDENGEIQIITSAVVPTASVIAPAGSLCVCTLAGSIGLYVNTGTAEAPEWKSATLS